MKNNKGISLIIIVLIIVGVLVVAGGVYYFLINKTQKPVACTMETKICPDGSSVGRTGPNCEFIECPESNTESGLIVTRKGVSGENFSKELAEEKKWDFLTVNTADYEEIRNKIIDFYNQKKFHYLLLIGTNEEIPYAIPNDTSNSEGRADYALYGDMNGDRFSEVSIGRLPFSSESELRKYYTDLEPKGDFISLESYAHNAITEDSLLEYDYGRCLGSFSNNIKVYEYSNAIDLINHHRDSAVLSVLMGAGGDDSIWHNSKPLFNAHSFRKNFDGSFSAEGDMDYLSNRPMIFYYPCNTAKELGLELIKNGASSFLGFYWGGGHFDGATARLLAKDSVGDIAKDIYNSELLSFTLVRKGELVGSLVNIEGINTVDILNDKTEKLPYSIIPHLILYGDPSLSLTSKFEIPEYNINTKQQDKEIIVEVKPPKILSLQKLFAENNSLLCYAGESVSGPSLINSPEQISPKLNLTFPVANVNRLKSIKFIVDGREIIPDLSKGKYQFNLLKGRTEQYLYISIANTPYSYAKDLKILVEYE